MTDDNKCALCRNYPRITCDDCGEKVCLHCATAISDDHVRCNKCQHPTNHFDFGKAMQEARTGKRIISAAEKEEEKC